MNQQLYDLFFSFADQAYALKHLSAIQVFAYTSLITALCLLSKKLRTFKTEAKTFLEQLIRQCFFMVGFCIICFGLYGVICFVSLFFIAPQGVSIVWNHAEANKLSIFLGAGVGVIIGLVANWVMHRYLAPYINTKAQKSIDRRSRDLGHTDIRYMSSVVPDTYTYDPMAYIENHDTQKGVFLGLGENKEPIYVDYEYFKKANIQIIGAPGTGKSVQAINLLASQIFRGEAVFVFDCKHDEWAPHVLRHICKKAGKPFIVIDLRQGQVPQFNPLAGHDWSTVSNMLGVLLGLEAQGKESDHYRKDDRIALNTVCEAIGENLNLPRIYQEMREFGDEAKGVVNSIQELAAISSIQTNEGRHLKHVLSKGGCVYVLADTDGEAVKNLAKLTLASLVNHIKARSKGGLHATIFVDEVKFMMCKPLLSGLSTVRDSGANFILAHQSLLDVEVDVQEKSAKSVSNTIFDNTSIKWVYRGNTKATAKWASDLTGTILADNQTRHVETNEANAELLKSNRSFRQVDVPLFGTNTLQTLPDKVALCIGVGVAKLAYSSPILVEQRDLKLKEFPSVSIENNADQLLPRSPLNEDVSNELLPKGEKL